MVKINKKTILFIWSLLLLTFSLALSLSFNYTSSNTIETEEKVIRELESSLERVRREDSLKIDSLHIYCDSIKDKLVKKESKRKLIKDKFKKVNPNIDNKFVDLFISVSDHYDLHPNEKYDLFISQLLVESRGRQYNSNGELMVGLAGEIGLSQIIPVTAQFYLERIISESEKNQMIKLGSDDVLSLNTEEDVRVWLSNRDNNVIMWGYIMNHNINVLHGKVADGFVAYNTGFGGLRKFKKNGHMTCEHSYYIRIQNMKTRIRA